MAEKTPSGPMGSLTEGKARAKKSLMEKNPVGCFALFGRSPSGGRAHFKFLFDEEQEAVEAGQRFASDLVAQGHTDFTYYVVEIKSRMGIEHGKLVC